MKWREVSGNSLNVWKIIQNNQSSSAKLLFNQIFIRKKFEIRQNNIEFYLKEITYEDLVFKEEKPIEIFRTILGDTMPKLRSILMAWSGVQSD